MDSFIVKASTPKLEQVATNLEIDTNIFDSLPIAIINDRESISYVYTDLRNRNLKKNYLRKVELLSLALKNSIRKNEFLQLSLELANKFITEKEYDAEIENNHTKYVIPIDNSNNESDFKIIYSILEKLNIEITIDEVAELFSIEYDSLYQHIKSLRNIK